MNSRSITKNYFYNTTLQVLMMIVPIITTPYLSRVIGAEGIGTYSYYYAIASYYVLFIKLGIDNYGNRAIAEHRDNSQDLNQVFSELVYLQLILGFIVSLVYLGYIKIFSSDSRYSSLFFLVLFASCIDINWFLYGMEEFKTLSICNACVKLISTILIFALVRNTDHVFLYCLILNGCSLLSQFVAWPVALRDVKFVKVSLKDILKHIRPNMVLFMSLISVSIFKAMDKVMLGLMTPGKLEVGLYEASERIIHIPNILVVSLGTVMMPRVTNTVAKVEDGYKKTILVSMLFSMFISSAMSFGIMGVAKEFVPVFYGPGFEKCVLLYLILLPCSLFMSFATVIRTQFLLPKHRDKSLFIASLAGAISNLLVNFLLIPSLGSIGAAIATLIAESIVCIYQVLSVRKELRITKCFFYSMQFVILGFIMFIILYNLSFPFIDSSLIVIALKIIIGFIIFILGSFLIFYVAEKRKDEEILSIIDKIRIKASTSISSLES